MIKNSKIVELLSGINTIQSLNLSELGGLKLDKSVQLAVLQKMEAIIKELIADVKKEMKANE